jgi:hypothetical protein
VRCSDNLTFTGTGKVTTSGSAIFLVASDGARVVQAQAETTSRRGAATIQSPPGTTLSSLTDSDITNNTAQCPPRDGPPAPTLRGTALNLPCDHSPAPPNYLCIAEVTTTDGAAPRPTGRVAFTIIAGAGTFNPATATCTLTDFFPPANRGSCAVQLTTLTTSATVRADYDPQGAAFSPSTNSETAAP